MCTVTILLAKPRKRDGSQKQKTEPTGEHATLLENTVTHVWVKLVCTPPGHTTADAIARFGLRRCSQLGVARVQGSGFRVTGVAAASTWASPLDLELLQPLLLLSVTPVTQVQEARQNQRGIPVQQQQ